MLRNILAYGSSLVNLIFLVVVRRSSCCASVLSVNFLLITSMNFVMIIYSNPSGHLVFISSLPEDIKTKDMDTFFFVCPYRCYLGWISVFEEPA